ncbi:DNA primase [bacterium]|nr:DNA primase [bacterium]
MSTTVEQIKSRLSIVDVVSSYIKLQKAGVNYKALCPFHNEKSPSMSVSLERGSFHCFGCGKGGDIFTFVQEMEGLDFVGALKVLAERAGVEITWDGKRENKDEKERRYAVLQTAADFFHGTLAKNKDALLYLKGRGVLAKTAEDFYLGFTNDSWDELFRHLSAKKYTGDEMEKAGLVLRAKEGRRGYYDRFRSRIIFPLADSAGRIVGFSGRIFNADKIKESEAGLSSEALAKEGAKYINSPETLLYNKSKILYGLHKAKQAIREKGFVVVVEGQMDLIMSHQAGVTNCVAVSGTALSEEHLKTLKRFADKIVFAFDSDIAGLNAGKRAVAMALALGFDVCSAEIVSGKDPADLVREFPDAWMNAVEDARHSILFFLDILKAKDKRAFRLSVEKEIFPLITAIKSRVDREHFIEVVAKEIGLSVDVVREGISKVTREGKIQVVSEKKEQNMKTARKDLIAREILGIILWKKDEKLRRKYEEIFEKYENARREDISPDTERELVFSIEKMYGNVKDLNKLAGELLASLEEELLKEEQERLGLALRDVDDDAHLAELQKRHLQISRRLLEVKKNYDEKN